MRNADRAGRLARGFLVLAAFALGMAGALAQTTERIVGDPRSGAALFGFDPVSYFIDGGARAGERAYETRYAGLVWRFRSEANRAAFAQAPARYVPAFGGYDPVSAADGVPVPGHPQIFAIVSGKLYLFAREEHRQRFSADPRLALELANAAWPEIRKTLVP